MDTQQLACECLTSFEDVSSAAAAPLATEWDAFIESIEGDIFLSFTWCRIWWKHYSQGRTLRLYLYRVDGALVGLMPVFYEQRWLGPCRLRTAKLLGADHTIGMVTPPVHPDYAEAIFEATTTRLLHDENCDAVCFGPLRGELPVVDQLRSAISKRTDGTLIRDATRSPYTTFYLPATYDDYMKSFNSKQRSNIKRRLRLLTDSHEVTQDLLTDQAAVPAEFDRFVELHTKQWQAEGKLGHFGDWPGGTEFNRDLAVTEAANDRLRLVRLFADGDVISYQLCYTFAKKWYWRLPARVMGDAWSKFALGTVGLVKEIELALEEGTTEIESGAGHYDYKLKLGGTENPLQVLVFVKEGREGRARRFLKAADLLHYFYYRVWFNKIAPKLPLPRRPLWKSWIRSRF
ncbi:MAG: GNAT family N-acetyltransferase [Planctomycetota bacterium]